MTTDRSPDRNVKCVIEYDGTAFVGWQRQARGRSVQGVIEEALTQILQQEVDVIAAGRTDAGVHARGQVINFRCVSALDVFRILGGLRGLLPEDIVVLSAEDVSREFHARYDAKEREYSYLVRQTPSALNRHVGWYLRYALEIDAMNAAAAAVLAEHDFTSFCRAEAEVANHVCHVSRSHWINGDGWLRYEIQADRFLHGMVRALVGTMVDIGRGATRPEALHDIFAARNRTSAGCAAPASGLVLEQVFY